jgi:hypothetical protein
MFAPKQIDLFVILLSGAHETPGSVIHMFSVSRHKLTAWSPREHQTRRGQQTKKHRWSKPLRLINSQSLPKKTLAQKTQKLNV